MSRLAGNRPVDEGGLTARPAADDHRGVHRAGETGRARFPIVSLSTGEVQDPRSRCAPTAIGESPRMIPNEYSKVASRSVATRPASVKRVQSPRRRSGPGCPDHAPPRDVELPHPDHRDLAASPITPASPRASDGGTARPRGRLRSSKVTFPRMPMSTASICDVDDVGEQQRAPAAHQAPTKRDDVRHLQEGARDQTLGARWRTSPPLRALTSGAGIEDGCAPQRAPATSGGCER